MKIDHQVEGSSVTIRVWGDIDSTQCNCLRAFWDCHIADDLDEVVLALDEVDGIDGPSVAMLVDIVRHHLERGARFVLQSPPQMLAHTLYKIGLLTHDRLIVERPRSEEPYAS